MLDSKVYINECLKNKNYSHKTLSHIHDAIRAIDISDTYQEYVTKLLYDEIDEKTFNKELRKALTHI